MKMLLPCLALAVIGIFPGAQAGPKITSFSTVLTEIAEAVGGDAVEVNGILKPGMDPHDYRPTPQDYRSVADAQLVLVSGAGMERYLDQLRTDDRVRLIEMSEHVPLLEMSESEHDHEEEGHHHHHEGEDPHWWHSVPNAMKATQVVRDELIAIDPASGETYKKNADAYLAQLEALNKWIKRRIAELPRDQRELVTSHDAFQYFAKEYGFEVHPIEGINHEQEASSREVTELIETIRNEHVKAIFLEDTLNPKVSTELTRETGVNIGGTLSADGLGAGDTATYEGMMKHNVDTIVDALK